jgi:hypothetical protein
MARTKVEAGNRQALLDVLRGCSYDGDPENAHFEADKALLEFIGDEEVTKLYERITRWYA